MCIRDRHSPWCKVVKIIEEFGGILRYPKLEAEYFIFVYMFAGINLANDSTQLAFTKCNYVNENSRLVNISDFAFLRMRNFLSRYCENSTLALKKLVSEMCFNDLEYLTILKFREPPL